MVPLHRIECSVTCLFVSPEAAAPRAAAHPASLLTPSRAHRHTPEPTARPVPPELVRWLLTRAAGALVVAVLALLVLVDGPLLPAPEPPRWAVVRDGVMAVVGWAAVAVGVAGAWPQVVRLVRSGRPDGVSWLGTVLGVGTPMLWLSYGLASGDAVQVTANTLGLLAGATALVVLAGLRLAAPTDETGRELVRRSVRRSASGLLVLAGLLTVALVVAAPAVVPVLGAVAAGVALVRQVPQAVLVIRTVRSPTRGGLAGLCPWTSALAVASAVLWLGYGLLAADAAVVVTSAVSAALGWVVLVLRVPPRRAVRAARSGRLGPMTAAVTAAWARELGPVVRWYRTT